MQTNYEENTNRIIRFLGGRDNIVSVANCMTRLRTVVKDEAAVNESALQSMEDVLGVVHDRDRFYEIVVGPGKSRKYADQFRAMGIAQTGTDAGKDAADWKEYKNDMRSRQKEVRIKTGLKTVGDIFVPLIPGIITAGLCAGFASLIAQAVPDYENSKVWSLIYQLLSIVNMSFMTSSLPLVPAPM